MNAIFKTGVIATLILLSFIGISFKQIRSGWKNFSWFQAKKYLMQTAASLIKVIDLFRDGHFLKNSLTVLSNIFLLSILVGIKILQPDVFYYALPCLLFFLLVINMDWILKTRHNPDFVGEAAIGYLIFIAYVVFIALFLFLITIYLKDTDTLFLFI